MSLSRPNPQEIPTFSQILEGANSLGEALGISELDSTPYKIAPQHAFIASHPAAQTALQNGRPIETLVGLDAGPRDLARYAHARSANKQPYDVRYPLIDWNWDRQRCIARIKAEGLPVPIKSACCFCLATKPDELASLPSHWLARIILLETRAQSRLRTVEGLWRKTTANRPGRMSDFISATNLLNHDVISWITIEAKRDFAAYLTEQAKLPRQHRTPVADWLHRFDIRIASLSSPRDPPTPLQRSLSRPASIPAD